MRSKSEFEKKLAARKEKQREYQKRYREKNAQKERDRVKKYREDNIEKVANRQFMRREKANWCMEEIECVTEWLDKMGAPTHGKSGKLSTIGRITKLIEKCVKENSAYGK